MTARVHFVWVLALVVAGCGPSGRPNGNDDTPPADDTPPGDDTGNDTCPRCNDDGSGVIDCAGNVTLCDDQTACSAGACTDPCEAAVANNSSVGCEYYTVDMDAAQGPPFDACYTVFVANTSREPAHMDIEWNGTQIDLSQYAKIPVGSGTSITYQAFDPVAGLQPGQVAVVFLAYAFWLGNVACPVPAAIGTEAQVSGSGRGYAFHVTTDWPVVAYQMLPYGGGAAAATGATLLLPTSAWGDNYVAVSAYDSGSPPPIPIPMGPSFNFVGKEDNTTVTLNPRSAVAGGGGLPTGAANVPYSFTVNRGEYVQLTQFAPLSGSAVSADKPIGMFGGHQIMSIDRCCGDHGEQMLAPVRALGYQYIAAPHADRKPGGEPRIFRIFGAVDGTQLTYDPPNLGPPTVNKGEYYEIRTPDPFVVTSQGDTNPFSMFTYMSGSGELGEGGFGDPDFVRLVPPLQYLKRYVFFTDPSYPFTVLTVVRGMKDGVFKDVTLDCLGGPVTGWQPVGQVGAYQIAYVKLVDHWSSQNGCSNGVRVMQSEAPFGLWVWGWGSEDTSTGWVSYGYPAGESVQPINTVVIE